jgi:hypothetical protein
MPICSPGVLNKDALGLEAKRLLAVEVRASFAGRE